MAGDARRDQSQPARGGQNPTVCSAASERYGQPSTTSPDGLTATALTPGKLPMTNVVPSAPTSGAAGPSQLPSIPTHVSLATIVNWSDPPSTAAPLVSKT